MREGERDHLDFYSHNFDMGLSEEEDRSWHVCNMFGIGQHDYEFVHVGSD